jgi:hypothetical protein
LNAGIATIGYLSVIIFTNTFMRLVIILGLLLMPFYISFMQKSNECRNAEITKAVIKSCFTETVWGIKLDHETYPINP